MKRAISARILKPKSAMTDQLLLNEANRKLRSLHVIEALGIYKEYFERSKMAQAAEEIRTIVQSICQFAVNLQKHSGKNDLPITILLWAEEQAREDVPLKKEIMQLLADAYKRAGEDAQPKTKSSILLQTKPIIKTKSDQQLKTFYFRGNKQASLQDEAMQSSNLQNSHSQLNSHISQKKVFLIKKKLHQQQEHLIEQSQQTERKDKLDWSSSDEDLKQPFAEQSAIDPGVENNQRQLRISFLRSQMNYSLEARVIEAPVEVVKESQIPIRYVVKIQSTIRRKLAQNRYKKMLREKKRQERQHSLEETVKQLQRWYRALVIRRKWIAAAESLLKIKRLTRYPMKEQGAAVAIQKWVRRRLLRQRFRKVRQVLRTRLYEHQFDFIPKTPFNRLFIFTLSKDSNGYFFELQPKLKKKCDRQINKKFTLNLEQRDFFYMLARLLEYIEAVESEIEPNPIILKTAKHLFQTCSSLIRPTQGSYELQSNVQTIDYRIKQIPFESLLYFDDIFNLQLYGFNDFQYSDMYIQDKSRQRQIVQNMKDLSGNEKIIIIAQTCYKSKLAVQRLKEFINPKRKIFKSFYVGNKVLYAQVFITKKQEIFAKWTQDRKWKRTNTLMVSELISKQMGYPCRENFFDIYQIKEELLTYTEEGHYWIQKQEDELKHKKKVSFMALQTCVIRIQKMVRMYLAYRQRKFHLSTKQFASKRNFESLVRKVVLQENPIKAYFMNFKVHFDEKGNKNEITIDVKPIEHLYKNEYIHSYKQPLFYKIEDSELQKIAMKMVEIGRVKQVKGSTRFEVSNLMEVQGILLNEEEKETVKVQRDVTLGARRILNQYIRKKWEEELMIDFPLNHEDRRRKLEKREDSVFQQIKIFYNFKLYRSKVFKEIEETKDVIPYDQESISRFVRHFNPISEYGFGEDKQQGKYNINFLEEMRIAAENQERFEREKKEHEEQEERQRKQEEQERIRLLREALCLIYHDYCVVSGSRLNLQIVFNRFIKQLIIKSLAEDGSESELILDTKQILTTDLSLDFLKNSVDTLVIRQLIFREGELIFSIDSHQQELLQMEYVNWEQQQQRAIDYSNLIGDVCGLEMVFARMNKSQSMLENLQQCQKQVFMIEVTNFSSRRHEYIFNLSDRQIILTVQFSEHPQAFKVHIIPITELKCAYLMRTVVDKPPQAISRLIIPLVLAIDRLLQIDELLQTNFLEIRPFLSTIFLEQYAIRIQSRLKIRQLYMHHKFLRSRSKSQIFISYKLINQDNRYLKASFFLCGYQLKMVFIKFNEIDPTGQLTEQRDKLVYYLDLLSLRLDPKLFRVSPDKWIEIEQLKHPKFYRNLYGPLIEYIVNRIRIETPFAIQFSSDIHAKKDVKAPNQITSESNFYSLVDAVINLQVHYKRYKQRERFECKMRNFKQNLSKARQIGKLSYRTYRKLETQHYLVNVYKLSKLEDQITVDFINMETKKKKNHSQYRGIYIVDPTTMLNFGQNNFYEFLLDQVYIEDDLLKFRTNDFMEFTQVAQERNVIENDQPTLQTQQPSRIELINHFEKHQDHHQPETIYNVIHSGQAQVQASEEQQNTVLITVDLADIKKLYPSLRTNDQSVMKMVSDQIIEGIRVDNAGSLKVDRQKINPQFIKIQQSQIHPQSIQRRENLNLITLAKKTAYYNKEKFLLVVNTLERRVKKIVKEDKDSVYSHFEQLFQIVATSLAMNHKEPIEWEMSSLEAKQLTHLSNQKQIAQELSKRTLIINERFVYLAIDAKDIERVHFENVILFLEKGIRPIQHRFRNRKRLINFRQYRNILKTWRDSLGQMSPHTYYSLENLKSDKQFILLAGEDKGKHLVVLAWDLQTFQKYEMELPRQKFQQLLMQNKKECIRLLASFVLFQDNGLVFTPPSISQMQNLLQDRNRKNSQAQL